MLKELEKCETGRQWERNRAENFRKRLEEQSAPKAAITEPVQ